MLYLGNDMYLSKMGTLGPLIVSDLHSYLRYFNANSVYPIADIVSNVNVKEKTYLNISLFEKSAYKNISDHWWTPCPIIHKLYLHPKNNIFVYVFICGPECSVTIVNLKVS